jgi:hypothetical protein
VLTPHAPDRANQRSKTAAPSKVTYLTAEGVLHGPARRVMLTVALPWCEKGVTRMPGSPYWSTSGSLTL